MTIPMTRDRPSAAAGRLPPGNALFGGGQLRAVKADFDTIHQVGFTFRRLIFVAERRCRDGGRRAAGLVEIRRQPLPQPVSCNQLV